MYLNVIQTSRKLLLLAGFFCFFQLSFSQTANFSVNNSTQCFSGNSFDFSNTSTGGATVYQWSFGDGATSTVVNPTHSYANYGNFSVQLIAIYAGIYYYVNKTVEVNAEPVCNYTYTAATLNGFSYTFFSTSTIGSGNMTYSWNFGDGGSATSSNPTHTYAANGTYTVLLTVTSDKGCICTTSKVITVLVSAGGTAPNSCDTWVQKADYPSTLTAVAFGFKIGNKGYFGTGYDGSEKKDVWEYDATTNIWTRVADFGGSARHGTFSFVIGTKAYVGGGYDGGLNNNDFWEYDQPTNIWTRKASLPGAGRIEAVGLAINGKGYAGTGNSTGYAPFHKDWYEYNPTTDTWTAKANYPGSGRRAAAGFVIGNFGYVGSGDDGTAKKDFYKYDPINDTWTAIADAGITPRSAATGFTLFNKGYIGTGIDGTGNFLKDLWEYDPTTNIWTQKTDFSGTARIYTSAFVIGCSAYFGLGVVTPGNPYSKELWQYRSCNCTDPTTDGTVTPAFTINNATQCLINNNFSFTNTSTSGATAYQWNFGDGTTSTLTSLTHSYANYGNYSVQLKATYGGIDYYVNKDVEVNAEPQCSFTHYAATGTGNSYSFQSTSSIGNGSMNYSWNFGDGGSANSSNPTHTYAANGTYTVVLTVTSDKGCICNTSKIITVLVSTGSTAPALSFTINNTNQCISGNNFTLTNTTANVGATYRWTFGDGITSNAANPSHSYATAGTYSINLIATVNGQDYYYPQQVTVTATPTASITAGTYCVGSPISVPTSATNTASIQWKNGVSIVGTNIPVWTINYTTVAGNGTEMPFTYPNILGSTVTSLRDPNAVYLDANKNMYIIDNGLSRVVKWVPGASTGTVVAKDIQVTGLGFDKDGTLYTTDDIGNYVLRWNTGATSGVVVAGGNGLGAAANQLNNPGGQIFIDNNYTIYITDKGNNRIQKWALGATTGVTVAGGNGSGNAANQLAAPTSIFVDGAATVYVVDGNNCRIQKWTTGATTGITVAGGNGCGINPNQLYTPRSVFVDDFGVLYINSMGYSQENIVTRWEQGAATGNVILNVTGSPWNLSESGPFFDVSTGCIYVPKVAEDIIAKYCAYSTSSSYTPITAGSYTAVINTFSGCSGTSNAVSIVNCVTPSISITAGTDCQASICAGTSITFTVLAINGGNSPAYQWKINGNNVGTNSNTFSSSSLINNDVVTCVLTNSDIGAMLTTATSNSITMKVNAVPIVSITSNGCTSGGLSVSGTGITGSSVTWLLAGSPVFTSTPNWDTLGVTVAGMLSSGSTANQLNSPSDVFIDANSNIYVCDIYNNRIQKFPAGSVGGTNATTVAGGNGNGYANNQLQNPYGFTLDASNNIYITNSFAHRIDKYLAGASSGTTIAGISASYGNAANQFQLPKRMVLDKCGNMYIADSYNHRVQKFAPGSTIGITVAGGNGNGSAANQLSYPVDVALDDAGNLYVCDNENSRIQKFAPNSTSASNGVTVAGGNGSGNANNQLNKPWGFTVDGAGNLLIADTYNNRVVYWAVSATTGVKVAGGNGYGTTGRHFNYPTNVTLDNAGNFYVSDEHNNRIQKFTLLSTAIFTPVTPGTYTAVVTNNSGCSTTTSAVNVATCATPAISIASGTGSCQSLICTGASTTFTSSITNGGSSPSYQWKVNGNNTGTNSSTFTTSSLNNNDIVTCVLTNNDVAVSPHTITSNSITVTVNTAPSLSITSITCAGSPVTYTTNNASASIVWSFGGSTVATSTPLWNTTTGTTVAGGTNGNAANQLKSPTDVFVDANGNIFVADLFNNRIQKFPSNSIAGTNATTVAGQSDGTGGSSLTTLNNPHGFTLDALGNVYITNSANHRIDEWTVGASSGVTLAGTGVNGNAANQLFIPRRMVLDGCGNMYITDTYNHRVQKWSVGATSGVTVAGGNGNGNAANQLKYPTDVALDAAGNLYVADADNHRIQKFAAGSTSATNGVTVAGNGSAGSALNQLDNPQGLYVDGAGNIYVADANNVRIMYWAAGAASGVLVAGGNGYGNAANQLNYPTNITLDRNGNIYVADEHNDRIQKFTLASGTFTPSTAGTYTATITGSNGCSSTQTINVPPCAIIPPSPSFTVNATNQCITGNNFVFTNTTSPVPSGTTYNWTFGDGSNSAATSPSHTYTTAGYYNVQMIATYNGQQYYANSVSVYVGAVPVASFAKYYNSPLTYTFNSTSTIASGSIASFAWNFGDGGTATTSNPQHAFANAGTYNVKLVVTSDAGCKDSITQSVVVTNTTPITPPATTPCNMQANFTINKTNQCVTGNQFIFTSTITGGTAPFTYIWDLNDGSTANSINVTKTYATYGGHDVTLKVTDATGCISNVPAQQIFIGAKPTVSFTILTHTGNGQNTTFISSSTIATGNMSYLWDLGNGQISTLVNPTTSYIPGTYTIKLVVTGTGGCKDSSMQSITELATASVRVFPNPVIDAIQVSFVSASATPTTFKLMDVTGRVLQIQTVIPSSRGANVLATMNTRGLQSGSYILYVSDEANGFLATKAILKQ